MFYDDYPVSEESPVGVFDSGMGGISVLRELRRMLPGENYIYLGDCLNAPYGTRTEDEIRKLAWNAFELLLNRRVKACVIACNTATSAAAPLIRERVKMPVIGMEPALKPASRIVDGAPDHGSAAVMATPLTLSLPKFRRLMELYGENAVPLPCPGLMEFVERGETCGPELDAYLTARAAEVSDRRIDAVVLGCTHYVFLRDAIGRAFPAAQIIDGNYGTARQLMRRLDETGLLSHSERGSVELTTTGSEADIIRMRTLLELLELP